jgi:hypothetical protein
LSEWQKQFSQTLRLGSHGKIFLGKVFPKGAL